MKTPSKKKTLASLLPISGTVETPTLPVAMPVKTAICAGRDYAKEPGKIEFPNIK